MRVRATGESNRLNAGYSTHAPVGIYRANAFGLLDSDGFARFVSLYARRAA